jgi:hypothetical protein
VRQAHGHCIDIPAFTFHITEVDVESYRRALGVAGRRVPLGMALRALTSEPVAAALSEALGGRHPIHIAQEYRAERQLRAGIDYVCEVRLQCVDADRLRVEQRLSDPSGRPCLTLASDIALVTPG